MPNNITPKLLQNVCYIVQGCTPALPLIIKQNTNVHKLIIYLQII